MINIKKNKKNEVLKTIYKLMIKKIDYKLTQIVLITLKFICVYC